jgi:YHS domain-containing protein
VSSKVSWAVTAVVFSTALPSGHTDDRNQTEAKRAAGQVTNSRPEAAPIKQLKPWEPVDASFNGCSEGFCGTRGKDTRAVLQPGAKVGDYTYCLVSGAVFQIKESHFRSEVNGKTVYFCCEGCARYFAANRSRVLAQRGLQP